MKTTHIPGHFGGAFRSTMAFFRNHRTVSIVAAGLLLYGLWQAYAAIATPSTATRYVTTTVATGTVVATMTESGQVSASANVNIPSQSSGEVLSVPVVAGEHVASGAVLAYLDPTNAEQSVADAKLALQSAQLALDQLLEPAATSTITNAQNAVATAQANLADTHTSGYNDVASAFLDLPNIVNGIDTILHGYAVPGRTSQQNENAYSDMVQSYDPAIVQYRVAAENSFSAAQTAYTAALAAYNATPRNTSDAQIEALVKQAYAAAADTSDALKAATNFLNTADTALTNANLTIPTILSNQISLLTAYTGTTNSHVSSLSGDVFGVANDERALAAAQASLAELQAGADPLAIQSSELSVQEKQDALTQAEQTLADTVVRAPFSGTVAAVNIEQYQTIGNGVPVATMVSDNQSVDMSVNEVDAAKLKVGQKATLTFDALPNVSVAGTVSSVNTIGSVSSGVVSYDAVVTFDTPNNKVLPGMSATVTIITGSQTGLVVPASAIKTAGTTQYVEVFDPPLSLSENPSGVPAPMPPKNVTVTTGISDDTNVIIESGLQAGTQVVAQTIAGAGAALPTSAAQSTSAFKNGAKPGIGQGALMRTFGR